MGELLARLEHLRRVLAAEGLFAAERKQRLPFLPGVVGLICGRASAAEKDVVDNARRRWPEVTFDIRPVAVQGTSAVTDVVAALAALDAEPAVEVIVIARGGGSLEDLLPFSNETLLRAVAACRTPVVSAIGHEVDAPLLDLVADVRASTPTDAARRVVPDVAAERAAVVQARPARSARSAHDSTGNATPSPSCAHGRCWPNHSGCSGATTRSWPPTWPGRERPCAPGSTAARTTCSTCGRGSPPCRLRRRWPGAMPWSNWPRARRPVPWCVRRPRSRPGARLPGATWPRAS